MKETKDQDWIEANGTNEVDIANTVFGDLPSDWQAENKAAAEVVVDLLVDYDGKVDLDDSEVYSSLGDSIHKAWLERNPWAPEEQQKPFSELSAEDQEKDIDQVRVALKLFSGL